MWNLKYCINESTYETETDSRVHREQSCGCQRGGTVGKGKWGRDGLRV